mmetsp:Transcript_32601/g.97504  ORF Transcript_32601/g.97504 Transcript_32601/m.97504 type:complete len:295 (-) Transcript_32601:53-937(-)
MTWQSGTPRRRSRRRSRWWRRGRASSAPSTLRSPSTIAGTLSRAAWRCEPRPPSPRCGTATTARATTRRTHASATEAPSPSARWCGRRASRQSGSSSGSTRSRSRTVRSAPHRQQPASTRHERARLRDRRLRVCGGGAAAAHGQRGGTAGGLPDPLLQPALLRLRPEHRRRLAAPRAGATGRVAREPRLLPRLPLHADARIPLRRARLTREPRLARGGDGRLEVGAGSAERHGLGGDRRVAGSILDKAAELVQHAAHPDVLVQERRPREGHQPVLMRKGNSPRGAHRYPYLSGR